MNRAPHSPRRPRTSAAQRIELLATFAASGLSAAAFARRHGLHYTTFCAWRHAQAKGQAALGFVQVELPAPPLPAELVVELGAGARLRLTAATQLALAAGLLHQLRTATSRHHLGVRR
jgi:transposase-like protein